MEKIEDRHDLVKELIQSGLPENQAEVIGKGCFSNKNVENFVTKQQFSNLEKEYSGIKTDITSIKENMIEMRTDIAELKTSINFLKAISIANFTVMAGAVVGAVITILFKQFG